MLQIITDGLPGRGGGRLVIMAAALLRNAAAASREQQYFFEHTGLAWQLMGTPGPHESVPREVEASHWCLSDSRGLPSLAKKAHSSGCSRTHCAVEGAEACWGCQVPGCPALGNLRKLSSGGAQWPGRGARTQKDGLDPDGRDCFSEREGLLGGNEMYLTVTSGGQDTAFPGAVSIFVT